jgi:hypothetical protein
MLDTTRPLKRLTSHAAHQVRLVAVPDDLDRRALLRWENEGGQCSKPRTPLAPGQADE